MLRPKSCPRSHLSALPCVRAIRIDCESDAWTSLARPSGSRPRPANLRANRHGAVVKKQAIPRQLLRLALEALPHQLELLRRDGADPRAHVAVFLDGRVAPGRSFAVSQFRERGAALADATTRVDADIKAARKAGKIFSIGLVLVRNDFSNFLRRIGGNQQGVITVEKWLDEPLPEGMFRLVVIAGPLTQFQLVSLDALFARAR